MNWGRLLLILVFSGGFEQFRDLPDPLQEFISRLMSTCLCGLLQFFGWLGKLWETTGSAAAFQPVCQPSQRGEISISQGLTHLLEFNPQA